MKRIFIFVIISLIGTNFVFGQNKVTGKVTASDTNEPIAYASIIIEGQRRLGTNTDENGKFTITIPEGSDAFVISYIGYKTQTIKTGNRTIIDIILEPMSTTIEESIIVAYGTSTKGTFTGAASVVRADQLRDAPIVSFENALSGKVSGMQVSLGSGQAGSASSIRIRGTGSMYASNEPLYVIDGVPAISGDLSGMGELILTSSSVMSNINPSDIESITVLKDAAAASLYGSRAANGVIIINTKRGRLGKPKIAFKSSIGITPGFATNNWKNATPEQQIEMYYELFWNSYIRDGKTPEFANEKALAQLNKRFNKHGYSFAATDNTINSLMVTPMTDGLEERHGYFDWEKALFRTGIYQSYDISASGGTENTSIYSSIGYTKDKGMSYTNTFDRFSGRVNVHQKVGKYIEFSTNISLSKNAKTGFNDSRNIRSNYFLLTRNMLWPMYWPTNYKTGQEWTGKYGSSAYNPLYYNKEQNNSSKTFKVSVSETLIVRLLPELTLQSIFSYDQTNVDDHLFFSAKHYDGQSTNGIIREIKKKVSKWVSSTTINYAKTFKDVHNLNLMAGTEAEKNNTEFLYAEGTNLPSSSLQTISTAGASKARAHNWGSAMASIFSRAEYNFDNKYFLAASLRRDGSSKLGPNVRWDNFWSVSGSWKIDKESFMKDVNFIDNLKLRASYGVNAILPPDNYGWRSLAMYKNKYNGQPGGSIANIADENLTWEKNYTYSIALEFGLLKNRINGSIEYFNRDTKDLLQSVPISMITGFGATLRNVGEMNNRGFEIEFGGSIIKNKNITWDVGLSASLIKSKITKLYGGQDIIWKDPTGSDGRVKYIYKEGYSNLSLFGFEWAGVDQENGKNVWYTNNDKSEFLFNGRNASYQYADADEIILADMNPKVYGGINTSLSWRGISLGLNFIYKFGGYTYDAVSRDINDDGYYWERFMAEDTYKHRWTYDKMNGKYPMRVHDDLEDAIQKSSRHKNPASFVRLKTISLSYNLPDKIISALGLNSARVYFNGTNLLTISAFKLYDPEVGPYSSRGWEMPFGKTYTFGVELSF